QSEERQPSGEATYQGCPPLPCGNDGVSCICRDKRVQEFADGRITRFSEIRHAEASRIESDHEAFRNHRTTARTPGKNLRTDVDDRTTDPPPPRKNMAVATGRAARVAPRSAARPNE